MRAIILCLSVATYQSLAGPQLIFGGGGDQKKEDKKGGDGVNTRLGLLATQLGLDPTASQGSSGASVGSGSGSANAPLIQETQQQVATGRVPGGSGGQQCCCVPANEVCSDPFGGDDLVGGGFIDPRLKNRTQASQSRLGGISTRIVNRPVASTNSQQNSCPVGQKACCYDDSIDLSVFGIICINPQQANAVPWTQGCQETARNSAKMCGTRQSNIATFGGDHADSAPGEFPWTCLLLNQDNDFVGSCAIIPDDFNNDNNRPTRKVITAAHKLKSLKQNDLLKVRVGEWDASGFNSPEQFNHEEYTVVRILKHPQFSTGRLSNDIALLYTDKDINLNNPYVNTACLPSCDNQFDYIFSNGTGVRCWVAGWGKDEIDGTFQFRQKKVALPLVPPQRCNSALKTALNNQRQGTGNRFQLHPSEVCAGGEVGKDACTGDGGSPLVCQAQSGRWTVVGLVSWGIGCASDLPGVYVKVSHYRDWINAN